MYLNQDGDLRCFECGAVIVLTIRRNSEAMGIRKNIALEIQWRMSNNGMQRKRGKPRKFLGG